MEIPNVKAGHIGRKIVGIRELKGIKQETLAAALGVTQQSISKIEKSETVDEKKLSQIADALGVSVETITRFNEDAILNMIQNNNENSTNNYLIAYQYNPIDKLVELYERLLASEKQKNELLEQLLKKGK
jgi:transcriptional regulator with XRE-family HTH domain